MQISVIIRIVLVFVISYYNCKEGNMKKKKKFYKDVTFENKKARKYLYEPIYYFAKKCKLKKFEYITNYVSHATGSKYDKVGEAFNVVYPVIISGTSISKIQIKDAKGNIFNIALESPNQIIYYELKEGTINCYIAKFQPKKGEKRFDEKRICYQIEENVNESDSETK